MYENNQAISSYDYDAWGNPMNSTVSEMSAYRYTGREYDDETGLHNFRARLYDSTLMRFYQVDPAEQFASPYVYCGNNPISLQDKDGCYAYIVGRDSKHVYNLMKDFFHFDTKFDNSTGQILVKGDFTPTNELEIMQFEMLTNAKVHSKIQLTRNAFEMDSEGNLQIAWLGGFSNGATHDPGTGETTGEQIVNYQAQIVIAKMNNETISLTMGHELLEGYLNALPGRSRTYAESYQASHIEVMRLLGQTTGISLNRKWMNITPIQRHNQTYKFTIDPFYFKPNSTEEGRYNIEVYGDKLWLEK